MDWLKDYWIWLLVAAILVAVIIWLLFIRKRDRAVNEPAASTRADATAPGAAEGGAALGAAGVAGAAGAGQAQDEPHPDAPDLGSPSYDAGEETSSADAGIEPPSLDAGFEDARVQPGADLPEASGLGGDDELGSTYVGETPQSRPAGSHRADLDDLTGPDTDVSAPEADLAAPEADVLAPEEDLAAPEADVSAPEAEVSAPATDASAEDAGATAGVAGAAGAGAFVAGRYAGSAEPAADGSGPSGYPIKGNEDSMLYHTEESPYYGRTRAEVWFDTEDNARAAGFTRWDEKDSTDSATEAAGFAAVPAAGAYGVGSADPLEGGASPHESFTIKGNADSMKYHTQESPYYGRTVAEVWFNTEEAAKGAGFARWDDHTGDEDAPAAIAGVPEGAFGPGSADPLDDGSAPDGSFTIKGNADSMLYHTEESPYYGRTRAEAWFNSEETARAAGFTRWDER